MAGRWARTALLQRPDNDTTDIMDERKVKGQWDTELATLYQHRLQQNPSAEHIAAPHDLIEGNPGNSLSLKLLALWLPRSPRQRHLFRKSTSESMHL
jgi:hypothetical protein